MKGALVCHPGTQHSTKLAECLLEDGLLSAFYTGCRFGWASRYLGTTANRVLPEKLRGQSRQLWLPEVAGKLLHKAGMGAEAMYLWRNGWFQRLVPAAAIRASAAVVGFDSSAWLLARRSRECGKPFLLDRTTIHRRARARIRGKEPMLLDTGKTRSDRLTEEVEKEEMERADRIVVASRFARDSLVEGGVPAEKISVIPYGVDADRFTPGNSSGKARFLFVGNLTPAKGIHTLLAAWSQLKPHAAELWLVGPGDREIMEQARAMPGVVVFGKLGAERLREVFRQASVFVFPTFFDGFGLVLLEALASGLPIITSPSCAGPELVAEAGAGEIREAGNAAAWAEALSGVMEHPAQWASRRAAARETAVRYSWEAYARRWAGLLRGLSAWGSN